MVVFESAIIQMKEKLLILHGGVGAYRVHFFEELSRRIPAHYLFYCKSIIVHQTDASELKLGSNSSMEYSIERRQTEWHPLYAMLLIFPRMVRAFFIHRANAVVVSEYSPVSAVAALIGRLFGLKVILWTDDSIDDAANISRVRKIQRLVLFKLAHRLIVINPEVARCYQKEFRGAVFISLLLQPEEPLREQLFSEKTTAHAAELIRHHFLGKAKIVLFVGRLSPEKNLNSLLRVFANVAVGRRDDLRLVLVGGGTEEEAIKALSETLGVKEKVIFAGHQPRDEHLWAWFRLAGLFVLPSLRERFGAVVNEALICGVPVLCSKHAGAACLIENSLMGEVFDPADNQKWTQVLLSRLNHGETANECCQKNRPSLMTHTFSEAVDQFVGACC